MIYIFLANGFEEIEALFPLDLFRRAGLDVTTVAIGESKVVMGAHGIPVTADVKDVELALENLDAIILPGGMPGTLNLENSATVQNAIKIAVENKKLICAICAAPSILGKLGHLNGRKATCFPGFEQYLKDAIIIDERVVRDGNFITAKGMGCGAEFGLAIIEALLDKEKAAEVAHTAFVK